MSGSKSDMPQDETVNQAESAIESTLKAKGPASKVSESRRKFTKAGLLAPPILMSVASRPAFGGGTPCISNMLSGNMSNPERGQCVLGSGPSNWVDSSSWPSPIDKGALPSGGTATCGDCPAGSSGRWKCGGTTFDDIFHDGDDRPMYQILCEDGLTTEKSAYIATYLSAVADVNYVFKPMQVLDLFNGEYPHVVDPLAFMQRSWVDGGGWPGTWL